MESHRILSKGFHFYFKSINIMEDRSFIFKFDNNEINFSLRGDGKGTMINATEMAKPFGKLFADWYRQKSTKEFLKALESVMGIPITDLVTFANLVLSTSESLYTMTEITKGLNLCKSSKDIYSILEAKNIIYHQGNKWFLRSPYDTLGLTKDVMIVGKDGKPHNQRRWTEKGKYFIMSVSL